jgi:hypothetical protein
MDAAAKVETIVMGQAGIERGTWVRLAVIVGMLAAISALHYQTALQLQHAHDIYRRLYYIPIVLGGLWFTLQRRHWGRPSPSRSSFCPAWSCSVGASPGLPSPNNIWKSCFTTSSAA